MAIFFMVSRHSPENCPMFNEKARKIWLDYANKSEEVLKKYGCKSLGAWVVPTEHLSYWVFEVPSLDAYEKLGIEPLMLEWSKYETYEVKLAYSMEEVTQMLQQAK